MLKSYIRPTIFFRPEHLTSSSTCSTSHAVAQAIALDTTSTPPQQSRDHVVWVWTDGWYVGFPHFGHTLEYLAVTLQDLTDVRPPRPLPLLRLLAGSARLLRGQHQRRRRQRQAEVHGSARGLL